MSEQPMTVGEVLSGVLDEVMSTTWPTDDRWYEVTFSARVDSDGRPWVDHKAVRPSWNGSCCHE